VVRDAREAYLGVAFFPERWEERKDPPNTHNSQEHSQSMPFESKMIPDGLRSSTYALNASS